MPTGPFRNVVDHARRLARTYSSTTESDRQLLARFNKTRDEDAFVALVERHGSLVLGVCRRVLGNEQDAQDAFQGTFLVLARKANKLQWRDSISNWLHGVAYRLALQVRDSQIRQRVSEQRMLETIKSDERRENASVKELCLALDEELARLPDRYQTALICCYLKGLTRDQAALECGWSLRTLDRRLQQGKELLKLRMLRRGISLSAALLVTGLSTPATQAGVSALLTQATARAALCFAVGRHATCDASPTIVALAERMSGLFTVVRFKLARSLCLFIGVISLGTAAIAFQVQRVSDPEANPQQPSISMEQTTPALPARQFFDQRNGDPLPGGALARFGSDRLKPMGNMMHMAFSPDGRQLAAWADETYVNNSLTIWEVGTGKLVRRVDLPGAGIEGLEWLADGRGLALVDTGHAELGPVVWEFTEGSVVPAVSPLRAFGARQTTSPMAEKGFAISPDGRTVAVGCPGAASRGGQVLLRELKASKPTSELFTQRKLATLLGNCELMRFTPDGTRLVILEETAKATDSEKEVKQRVVVLEVSSGKEICRFLAAQPTDFHANRPPVSASNRELAIGHENGSISLWNLTTGEPRRIQRAHSGRKDSEQTGTMALAFSQDGSSLVTGGYDGLVKVWETSSGKLVHSLPRNSAGVESLAIAPDNRTIAAGYDGFVRLWDAQSGADKCPQPGHEYSVRQAVLSLDGKTAVTSSWDSSLRWWNTSTGRELRKIDLAGKAESLALSPDGRTIVAAVEGKKLRTWNLIDGNELRSIDLAGEVHRGKLLFTPDCKRVLAASNDQVQIFAWPELTLHSTLVLPKPEKQPGKTSCQFLTVSSDSRWLSTVALRSIIREERGLLYESTGDGIVELWDLETGKRVRTIAQGKSSVQSAHFTSDSRLLLTGALNYAIPAQNGRPAEDFSDNISELDPFTPRWLRSFNATGTWDQGKFRHAATTQPSSDGRTLYVGYNNGDIRAYEVATGQLRRQFRGHRSHVYCLACTPDGAKLVSGGRDGNAIVWNTALASMAEPRKQPADDATAERLWSSIPLENAEAAYIAMANLALMPEQSVKLLRSQIEALREPVALEEKPAVRVRQIRALELLEAIATPSARALLEELAKGDPMAPVTVDARATLARLRN